ncbi:unnamed protein product [Xylocopa violacea]|uniref:Uncharacterized protein n=1 Tax=Xylocopa violacea TaxID=135666 RepID=A0ABP1P9J6_XYLVO
MEVLRRRYLVLLCTLSLTESSASSKPSRIHDKFYYPIEAKSLSRQQTENLSQMLNFIRESPEFQPCTFSVILPEFQSSFVDFFLRYIGENRVEAYKVRARDLSLKATWMERVQLTWIIVVPDLYSLNIGIYWQPKLWKPSNQYLIVYTGEKVNLPWRDVFAILWRKYNVYRAVVVSTSDDFRCLMRYKPFEVFKSSFGVACRLCLKNNPSESESSSEHKSLRASPTDEASADPGETLLSNKGSNLFENFQNLNYYTVDVRVFESQLMDVWYDEQNRLKLGKLDANVVSILEKAMRAEFRVTATRKIDFREDPFSSSLRSIESGETEMVITGFFVKVYGNFQRFQYTCALYEDKLCFLSPDSGIVPKAYMPFLPFQKTLWALLMVYNIVITLLWCFVKYISVSWRSKYLVNSTLNVNYLERNARIDKHLTVHPHGLFNTEITTTPSIRPKNHTRITKPRSSDSSAHQEPPEFPRRISQFFILVEYLCYPFEGDESPAQRALLSGTLFFSLIVNGLYQSYLVSTLSKPLHYPQLRTLEDVLDTGKTIITKYANLKDVFVDDSPLDAKLSQRIRVISSQKSTKDFVAYDGRISLTRYYTVELENNTYYDKEGNSLLYVVDECPMKYRVSYVLKLHSPYAERVDFLLLRVREAGLLNFWFEDMMYPIRLDKMKRKLEREKRKVKLTLDHYCLTFLLLFVGLFGSAIMFFVEIYLAKRNAKRRSNRG